MKDAPASMRAVVLEARNTLRVVQVPVPQPAAGEVLVRVHASGVNPLDLKISDGRAAHARHLWCVSSAGSCGACDRGAD